MKLEYPLLLLLSFSSLLHLVVMTSSPSDELSIKAICEKSEFPAKCVSSIENMTPGVTSSTAVKVVSLHMTAAAVNIQAALTKATELAADPNSNPSTKSILNVCIENYGSASKKIEEANKALSDNDKPKMMKYVSMLRTYFTTCEEAISKGNLNSPLREYADMNAHLAGNGLAIVNAFWPSSQSQPRSLSESESSSSTVAQSCPTGSLGVKAICDKSKYPELCLSSVQSVASGALSSTDAPTILHLTITSAIFTTQIAIDKAKVFAKVPETDERTKDILLNVCATEYEKAIKNLEEASKAIEKKDKFNMRTNLTEILQLYSRCENAFKQAHLTSLMTENQDLLIKLAENNVAIAKSFWPDNVAGNREESQLGSSSLF